MTVRFSNELWFAVGSTSCRKEMKFPWNATDLNSLLGFDRLGIKSTLEILHSNCCLQSEPVTVVQAVAACAALSPASMLAVWLLWLQIQKLENFWHPLDINCYLKESPLGGWVFVYRRFPGLLFYLSLPSLEVNGPFCWKIEIVRINLKGFLIEGYWQHR